MAYALPRVNVLHPGNAAQTGKQAAYAETWEIEAMPRAVGIDELALAMRDALDSDRDALMRRARELATMYRAGAASLVTQAIEG
jgi:hypothetical protein